MWKLFLFAIVLSVLTLVLHDSRLRCLSFCAFSFCHCVVCPLRFFTDSDYLFGIYWPLCCLSFALQILITCLVSIGHCVVCPSLYRFWLPVWYLLAIVLSVLYFTDSDYLFGIYWPLCCLSFALQILITCLVSIGHCVVCPSLYRFWLPVWYLLAIVLILVSLAIVLSVLYFTDSDYLFGIYWPLCCLSFTLQILITCLVSIGHCVVCPLLYRFWLPVWYLLAIVLSVLRFTDSDYLFGIYWPLCCLSFALQILITCLVSIGHCVVCPSLYRFWLPVWYLLAIVLSVALILITCLVSIGHCVVCPSLQILITCLVSIGHCVVCPSLYRFWLPVWYLLAIVLSVLRFTDSDYLFGIYWPLCCLYLWPLYRFWLPVWYLLAIVLSVLRFTDSDYLFGIYWPLCCLSFALQILITCLVSIGHCVVCPSLYRFWLPVWYLLAIVLSVLRFTDSDYLFGIYWPLCCLSFCPSLYRFWLPVWYLLAIVLSVLRFTDSDYLFGIYWPLCCLSFALQILITCLVSIGHCVVCPSLYRFWLPVWYLLAIVLSVLRFTDSDYLFGIYWPLCCLSFALQILITCLVSIGHCVVCPSLYRFWLPVWYLLAIVLSVLYFTDSDYLFGIYWPLCCLSFALQILITCLVSIGHCVVCPSLYRFWLPVWYLLAIVLSVLYFTDSDYLFGIYWPLCCLSFALQILITCWFYWPLCCLSFALQILITCLVSIGHCVVCPSLYRFWLPVWYLLAIVLSVLRFTDSDYLFGIYWPLCCLSFALQILITCLVSIGHCVVCPSLYRFWLPVWYLLAIVLSVLRFTDSDYLFGIYWPLCCLSFALQILITCLVSIGHCVVCPSLYRFWLPVWYLLAIVLSVLRFTDSDYLFGIYWPLCCLSFLYRFWLPLDSDYLFGIYWPLCCLSFALQILITCLVSIGHCVVCPSLYRFWLPVWYLLAIVLSVLRFTDSDYLFGIYWPLCCLSFALQILITCLVSIGHCVVCPSLYRFWLPVWYLLAIVLSVLRFTDSDYLFGIYWPLCCLSFALQILITCLVSIGHCVVCPSLYRFWLPVWYLLAIVLSVLRFTDSDYLFGIYWPLCCLSFALQILITCLVSIGHCVVCPSLYRFWLPVWYLLAIVLSVLRFTDSDYLFGIYWPLCCLSFALQILITCLVSIGHCVVCPSLYRFWLPVWYLLAIVLSVLITFTDSTDSDYLFGIYWPLCCLSFALQILITCLVSIGHCVVCPSLYRFWLPVWYLLAIVLSVLRFTDSDYLFGIYWPLCCLSFALQILITCLVSIGHCVVCPSLYRFWLPVWYLLAIVLSVLRFTDSDYLFGIYWPLCCLSFALQILITCLVSIGHCVVCPSLYRFWLPVWYLLAIVLSVLRFTDSDYLFGIYWPLCCLSFALQILITCLVSIGHCVVCPSLYRFWLPVWYLLAIVLSVLRFTDSDYLFGIYWPLCCLSFALQILITCLVSIGHCVVCPSLYRFWLPVWYLLAIVLSVLRFTDSDYLFGIYWPFFTDYLFGIYWPLCCLSFALQILITCLVSIGHCVVCPSLYRFWLPVWYLLAIVLSVLRFTDSDYLFGIYWPLCCLSFALQILITCLVSIGHCVVCPSLYRFWLPVWYLLAIVLSVLRFTDSDYLFGIYWPLCCLSFALQILITCLVSIGHCVVCPSLYRFWLPVWYLLAIVLSVLRFTDSDYLFGIYWPLCCLSFALQILITCLVSIGHCVVCPSLYRFWLPVWYLLAIVLSVLRFTDSDYLFGIYWPLCCLSFALQILITCLVSIGHCVVCPSLYRFWLPVWYLLAIVLSVLRFTDSDYLFGIYWPLCCLSFALQILITCLVSIGHCVVCPSLYRFWLPVWYLLAIVLSVLRFTDSDYLFGIYWPLCCLSFALQILITCLVSIGHCVVCPSLYRFWLPVWYLLAIVLSVLRFTDSDYLFGIYWPLCCLSFALQILITCLVSIGHCVVCPSLYRFWLPVWYLLAIVLSVLRFTDSDYLFGIYWPLCCLSFALQILITCLVSIGHCVVCPSLYRFWLPVWYLLAIVLSVLRFTDSDYLFGIYWPLCCLSFALQILITCLVSIGHCVVCPSLYRFWLPVWYLLAIVLSVLRFTDSDYLFGIYWPLCCLSFALQILITCLVSIGHCVVCPSLYRFSLPVWYLLAIVLSVLRFTDSDYLFGIYWPLCCLSFALQILITCLVTSNSSWNFHTSMNNYRHFWKYWILNIAFKCIFCRYRQTESRLQEAKPGWSISKNRFCPCV